jgi:polar amino acid transport system substrate-binding protein
MQRKESIMSVVKMCVRRGGILASITLLLSCASQPAGEEPLAEATTRPDLPTLKVGTSPTAPPIVFEENGETVGLEADFAHALAAELGMKPRFVNMFWPNLIRELRAGRIDIIMAGMSVTDERRHRVAFITPYLTTGQAALIRAADEPSLGSLRQVLATRRPIGVEGDSTGEAFVTERIPRADRRVFPIVSQAVEALVVDEVDAVVHDRLTLLWLARDDAEEDLLVVPGRFTDESLAWAVSRDNDELRDQVEAILERWERTGRLEEIINRWVPAR